MSGSPPARFNSRLSVWFLLTTIVPAVALVWFGWTLIQQDRSQQAAVRAAARDHTAALAATSLQRTLAELDEQVSSFGSQPTRAAAISEGAAVATFGRDGLIARAGLPLPFYPVPSRAPSTGLPVFDEADLLEAARREAEARLLVEPLTHAASPDVRAGAWLRLARLSRKLGRHEQALDAFGQLAMLDDAPVFNQAAVLDEGPAFSVPAGLIGLQGRALALVVAGDTESLGELADRLLRALEEGRWVLDRSQYEFARSQALAWRGETAASATIGNPLRDDRLALAEAAEALWHDWQRSDTSAAPARARTTRWMAGRSVLVMTRSTGDRLTVLLAGPRLIERSWTGNPESSTTHDAFSLALSDADGRAVIGDPHGAPLDRQSLRTQSVTQLPWTVHVMDTGGVDGSLSRQAVGMLAALGMMLGVVGAGGYLITRTLAREMRVVRMQSDFVAAVSHEFRTPLTTVRHLGELLARDRVSSDGRRREFYQIIVRESGRLQRLVENLLNFARLESGELDYRFATFAPGPYLRHLVQEFQEESTTRQAHISIDGAGDDLPPIRADGEVLARVFWNLLDNAVKYSPPEAPIRVAVDVRGNHLVVSVRDHGMGIPITEQATIFQKFVRGAAAKAASIKGTGLGLAMAREIVLAHGGTLQVESTEGEGSTFSVAIPVSGGSRPSEEPDSSASMTSPSIHLQPDEQVNRQSSA
jgi:signal transduction histidine kinase